MAARGTVKVSRAMMMLRGEDAKILGSLEGKMSMTIIPPKMQADTGADGAFSVT